MLKLKEELGSILMFLGEIIVGILLLINPIGFTKTIIIGAGLVLTVIGVLNMIRYFKTEIYFAMKEQSLSMGLMFLAIGLFCVFWSDWFMTTFPVLTVIYGVSIIFTGLKKIEWTVNAIRLRRKYWYITGINAVLTIIFSLVVICNPFSTIALLWQFTGVILIIESIFDVVSVVFDIKENDKEFKGEIIEHEKISKQS